MSPVCHRKLVRESEQTPTPPHTSPAGVPDRRCGRDGSAEDRAGEQACRCLPGFPLQVATGLPCPGPEGPETGQIAGGRGHALFGVTEALLSDRGTNLLSI